MHSNSPDNLLQFRGNKKCAYYDNSGAGGRAADGAVRDVEHLHRAVQQQDPAPGHGQVPSTPPSSPRSSTRASTRRCSGLFLPGSEYYTKTAYPKYDPAGAAKLVKQVQQQTGKPVTLHPQFHQQPGDTGGGPVPAAGLADGGHEGDHQHHGPGDAHQRRAGRDVPGHAVAPVRRRRPRPELRVVEHQTTGGRRWPSTWPATATPAFRRRCWRAGPRARRRTGSRPTNRSTSTWPRTSPTSGWPATPGPSWPTRRCRTSPTRRRVQHSKAIAFDEGVLWPTQIWMK